MEVHGMILFLSTIHFNKDGTLPVPTDYQTEDRREIKGCIQTNEAAMCALARALEQQNKQLDHVFYFASVEVCRDKMIGGEMTNEAAFVEQHLKMICPSLKQTRFHQIAYDEEDPVEESIHYIGRMAEFINRTLRGKNRVRKEIVLHADVTGGPRNASMMMLNVMRLMEYCGIRGGEVYYTDYNKRLISSARSVYRTFALVSGVDEFVRYGSVRSLEEYFNGTQSELEETSPELKALLRAMHEFSDAIRICRTGVLEENLRALHNALRAFQEKRDREYHEMLFGTLMNTLSGEYGALLTEEKPNRLDIIRWCRDKGFLQQAMTLCTEWLPVYFVDNKIYYTDDECIIDRCDNGQRTWEMEFVINYKTIPVSKKTDTLANRIKALRALFSEMKEDQSLIPSPEQAPFLIEKDLNLLAAVQRIDNMRARFGGEWSKHLPAVQNLVRYLYENRPTAGTTKWSQFERKCTHKHVLNIMHTLPVDTLQDLFSLGAEDGEEDSIEIPCDVDYTMRRYAELLENGIAKTNYGQAEVLSILESYRQIREQRNQINHGNYENVRSAEEVEKLIDLCLAQIDSLRRHGDAPSDVLQRKIAVWQSMPRNNPSELAAADGFFDAQLMPLAKEKFCARAQKQKLPAYYGMILTLGTSWQPLALTLAALRPQRAHILCTKETAHLCERIRAFLALSEDSLSHTVIGRSDADAVFAAVRERHSAWAAHGACAMDITGGTKAMASAAAMIAAVLGIDIYYVESTYLPLYRRPLPGSERLERLPSAS